MSHFFSNNDDTGIVFRDTVFLMMIVFVVLFLIAVFHINPDAKKHEEETVPPGNIIVNIFWEDGKNIDVDLWMKGPGDKLAVGYSNRAGRTFNLLRDDLGMVNDDTDMNFENGYTRGLPDGNYIINVHMYANKEVPPVFPVNVKVVVSMMGPAAGKSSKTEIFFGEIPLHHNNEEVTVVQFQIKNKQLVKGSVNSIQQKIRNVGVSSNPWLGLQH